MMAHVCISHHIHGLPQHFVLRGTRRPSLAVPPLPFISLC